jgi:transposase
MKAMARQRSHSIEFKRQVAQEFIAGESLYALSKRHDISRQLIRVWVEKYEAGALDEDAQDSGPAQMTIPYLEKLNPRQRRAVEHSGQALILPTQAQALIIAGAVRERQICLRTVLRTPNC